MDAYFDLLLTRAALLIFGWWILPLAVIGAWIGDLGRPHRLTLREDFAIAWRVIRDEWRG
jgi:hypothetical protein